MSFSCMQHTCTHTCVPNEPPPNTQVHAHMCTHPHPGMHAHTHTIHIDVASVVVTDYSWNNAVSFVTSYELGGPGIET
jgi:hypothetical protein